MTPYTRLHAPPTPAGAPAPAELPAVRDAAVNRPDPRLHGAPSYRPPPDAAAASTSDRVAAQGEPLLPAFLRLAGRKVVLVGGGVVAKHAALVAAGAEVTVVAPRVRPELRVPGTTVIERGFVAEDLDGAWFAVAAAPPEVNRAVLEAALPRRLFVNAADDPPAATAFAGSVARRGPITIAVSTGGTAPALAALVREGLEALLPADLDRWIEASREARARWRQDGTPMPSRRPLLLAALNDLYAPDAESRPSPRSGDPDPLSPRRQFGDGGQGEGNA